MLTEFKSYIDYNSIFMRIIITGLPDELDLIFRDCQINGKKASEEEYPHGITNPYGYDGTLYTYGAKSTLTTKGDYTIFYHPAFQIDVANTVQTITLRYYTLNKKTNAQVDYVVTDDFYFDAYVGGYEN